VSVTRGGRSHGCALPFAALSLSRRRLDEALLAAAARAGAILRRGVAVQGLEQQGGGWRARLAGGGHIAAREAFLCTGKHDLRGWRRPPGPQPDLLGFKLHLRLQPAQAAALARRVEITLFPGGYAGLQPVEGGQANLCLVVRRGHFMALGGQWPALLAQMRAASPDLSRRLDGAEALFERPLSIAAIPYGFVRRRGDGCWHLGDQAAVIPSFAGEGMSIALHSAALAARCFLRGEAAAQFQRHLCRDVSALVWRATALSRLLVRGWGQSLLLGGLHAAPAALAMAAAATRLPAQAVRELTAGHLAG
jgi:flavin-dependent dehydrogenase